MGLNCGIVGLPNVGKSTIFKALTSAKADIANYPFCTIEPNVGIVEVPDERLLFLKGLYPTARVVPAAVEFVDIAGLVKGASQGAGLGNKFLSHIREVDAISHVVRCFDDADVVHVDGSISPIRDIETTNTELALADLESVVKRKEKARKRVKARDKGAEREFALLEVLEKLLNEGRWLNSIVEEKFSKEELALAGSFNLLTLKPLIYLANVPEGGGENPYLKELEDFCSANGFLCLPICGKLEEEIAALSGEERRLFLEEMEIGESGVSRLIRTVYRQLGLITFLTAGDKEVRAWTTLNESRAPHAAGVIHSDFEKGFIRAEIVSYADLKAIGSYSAAKAKGLIRSEGKEYVMKDGDVVNFRFNV